MIGTLVGAALIVAGLFLGRRHMRRLAAEKASRVLYPTFDRTAMYRQRKEDGGAAGELPAGTIVKDRRGYGSGSPLLADWKGTKPPAVTPLTEEAPVE